MRRAINNISLRKDLSIAFEICTALRYIQSSFQRIYIPGGGNPNRGGFSGDLHSKIEVMKSSVSKVESACYNMHVRGSEKPDGWSGAVEGFGKEDGTGKRGERESDDDEFGGRGKRQRVYYD